MKVKRYAAANSREALARVKQELGPDAVILSNRAVGGGVEILALAQDDVAGLVEPRPAQGSAAARKSDFAVQPAYQARPSFAAKSAANRAGPTAAKPAARAEAKAARPAPAAAELRTLKDFAARVESPIQPQAAQHAAPPASKPAAQTASHFVSQHASRPASPPMDGTKLLAEMKAMRGAVERQLAGLAWNEDTRRRPLRARLLRELIAAGFSAPLGRRISGGLPDDFSEAQARNWLQAVLAKNIRCDSDADSLVQRGGTYALVGPTGVGKTTTVAKLAAHCVVRFGAQKLALVSTDSYRIGAQDQLRIYAKILGVPVHVAQDASELDHTLRALGDRHMVLIDTVGMGQRDTRLAEQLALLAGKRIQRILLLNATAQLETLEDVIRVYKGAAGRDAGGLAGAIVTKLDEARRPGGAIDAAIRHKLKLAFVTDGQRVPEDLHLPDAAALVERSLAGAGESPFALEDDEFMWLPGALPGEAGQ